MQVDALKQLRCIAAGDAAFMPEFRNLLKEMVDPLAASISDLRSAVVKEATVTTALVCTPISCLFGVLQLRSPHRQPNHVINQLAERLQNKFGYMADQLLPALLRQTYVNIKVRLSVPLSSLLSLPAIL